MGLNVKFENKVLLKNGINGVWFNDLINNIKKQVEGHYYHLVKQEERRIKHNEEVKSKKEKTMERITNKLLFLEAYIKENKEDLKEQLRECCFLFHFDYLNPQSKEAYEDFDIHVLKSIKNKKAGNFLLVIEEEIKSMKLFGIRSMEIAANDPFNKDLPIEIRKYNVCIGIGEVYYREKFIKKFTSILRDKNYKPKSIYPKTLDIKLPAKEFERKYDLKTKVKYFGNFVRC